MIKSKVYSQLVTYGFEQITYWELYKDRIRLNSLAWDECAGWIYAYVAQDKVHYIGITTMVLRSRLDSYSYQIGDRVRALICECLMEGNKVEIFGTRRSNVERVILEAEESKMIKIFETDWNVRE